MQNSANAVIMVLTYFKALGARSLCEGAKIVFITPSSLADFLKPNDFPFNCVLK